MIYRSYKDLKISNLGMGAMRLPVIDGDDSKVDVSQTEKMVEYAMTNGINYYDTAWGYHGENSETVMGKVLSRYPRETYYLADKFPGYDLSNMDKVEDIFEKQLKKCGVEYFDFYLLHNVCEMNIEQYLDKKYGIMEYLCKQKENRRIKNLGLSTHGSYDTLKRFLQAYGDRMEFCQIQMNYLDLTFQNAGDKLELLAEYDIPVFVMEPMRGGSLAKLSKEHENKLMSLRHNETIPAWAFRFLQSIPNVVTILSGASDLEQMKQNVDTFKDDKPLNEEEMKALLEIADEMLGGEILPCTACRYCIGHCPEGLEIPELLKLYNEHKYTKGGFIAPMALMAVPEEKHPKACVGCKNCEAVCPQKLKISEAMADFAEKLEASPF